MKNLVIAIFVSLLFAIPDVFAQEIKIKSFSMLLEPMTVPMQRKDNNGNICALVKVIVPDSKAVFEGSIVGDCDFKTSEYWCYLTPGSKLLKIKYPGSEPLLVNFVDLIGAGLKSSMIYELLIELPTPAQPDLAFTIKGSIDIEKPNEKGLRYGEKIPYSPGYTLFKNYFNGNYEGKWNLKRGPFTVSDIKLGDSLTLFALDNRYEPQTITITQDNIGNSDFNFFLTKKKVNLKGYLVDQDSGLPIADAEVSADNKTWFKTNEKGFFSIENLIIDKAYTLKCNNAPYGYLTYEGYSVIPISSPVIKWPLERNSISATIELNGVDASEIRAFCDDGHEASVEFRPYGFDICWVRHPLHSEKPALILKAKGHKTIRIDFEGYLATPKNVKFQKGDEDETIHYVVQSIKGKPKLSRL